MRFFWRSFKCLQLEDEEEKLAELKVVSKYWVVYGLLHVFEIYLEMAVSWFPLYYSYKLVMLLLIFFPALNGAEIVYKEIAEPELLSIEESVDSIFGTVEGYWNDTAQWVEDVGQGYRDRRDNFVQGVTDRRDAIAQGYQERKTALTNRVAAAFTFNIQFPTLGWGRGEQPQRRNRGNQRRQAAEQAANDRWFIGRQWDAMMAYFYPEEAGGGVAQGTARRKERDKEKEKDKEKGASKEKVKEKVYGALETMLGFKEEKQR